VARRHPHARPWRLVPVMTGFFVLCGPALSAQKLSSDLSSTLSWHEVRDEYGRTVRIPLTPMRILSLAPSITETLYALGVEDRLVGDTDFCDFPPEAQKKPKVGGAIDPNLEQIAALHPDLVLVAKSLNRLETVRALETLGIPTYVTDPHTVDEILSSTQKLAQVLNVENAGRAVREDLERRLLELQVRLKGLPPRRVLFIVWTDPLISIGGSTFIADALHKAGAVSIIESTQDWPQVSLEEVVRAQPEFLVFAASHSDAGVHDFELLVNRPGWDLLEAVRNRRFAVVSDAVNRPAPRMISAIEELARQLHPEVFSPGPEPEPPGKPASAPAGAPTPSRPAAFPSSEATACSPEFPCAR